MRSGFALLQAKRKQKSKPADTASNNDSALRASPFATLFLSVDAFLLVANRLALRFIFRFGSVNACADSFIA